MSPPPLYVRLLGGLGNQLFQYATGRAVAERLGAPLLLDGRYVLRKGQHTGLAIQAFRIRATIASTDQLGDFPEWRIRLSRGLRRQLRPLFGIYHEWGLGYDPAVFSRQPGQMLSGFWQSERYFLPLAQQLRDELQLATPLPKMAQPIVAAMQAGNSVALHVRRGDYTRHPAAHQRHGACSVDYYNRAIGHLCATVDAPIFFVFSDDIPWVQAHLNLPAGSTIVSRPGLQPEHDLALIAQCRHQIISNSTFSWWGAWLNANEQKTVVAPDPWFDDPALDASDLVPPGWIKLPKQPSGSHRSA